MTKILVIDDDIGSKFNVYHKDFLKMYGKIEEFEFIFCDGKNKKGDFEVQSVLNFISENSNADIILLDKTFGDNQQFGIQVLEEVYTDIPVLMFTDEVNQKVTEQCLFKGAVGFLQKYPCLSVEEFKNEVEKFCCEDTKKGEKKMKVLVVDDKMANLMAAHKQLTNCAELTAVGTYDDGQELLIKEKHDFEVVMVDLLMPASEQKQGLDGKKFVGQEMPIGIFLALLAAKNGAKYVAVFTDSGHHDHPASACLDVFNHQGPYNPIPFKVDEAQFFLCNNPAWVKKDGKDWKALMDYMLGEKYGEIEIKIS